MAVSERGMSRKQDRNLLFPWIKDVNAKFSKTFPGDYEVGALDFFHMNVDKEYKKALNGLSFKRMEALFENLTYFYSHFCWKIKWKSDSPDMKASCVKILRDLCKIGLILSKGNLSSQWMNKILAAIELFPGCNDLLYNALLLITNLKKKYHDGYALILKSVLYQKQNITENAAYLKVVLLYRRLKMLLKDKQQKAEIMALAARISPPPEIISWLSSQNLVCMDGLMAGTIVKEIMGKAFPKVVFQKLRQVLLGDKYLERTDNLENILMEQECDNSFVVDTDRGENESNNFKLQNQKINEHSFYQSEKPNIVSKNSVSENDSYENEFPTYEKNISSKKRKRKFSTDIDQKNDAGQRKGKKSRVLKGEIEVCDISTLKRKKRECVKESNNETLSLTQETGSITNHSSINSIKKSKSQILNSVKSKVLKKVESGSKKTKFESAFESSTSDNAVGKKNRKRSKLRNKINKDKIVNIEKKQKNIVMSVKDNVSYSELSKNSAYVISHGKSCLSYSYKDSGSEAELTCERSCTLHSNNDDSVRPSQKTEDNTSVIKIHKPKDSELTKQEHTKAGNPLFELACKSSKNECTVLKKKRKRRRNKRKLKSNIIEDEFVNVKNQKDSVTSNKDNVSHSKRSMDSGHVLSNVENGIGYSNINSEFAVTCENADTLLNADYDFVNNVSKDSANSVKSDHISVSEKCSKKKRRIEDRGIIKQSNLNLKSSYVDTNSLSVKFSSMISPTSGSSSETHHSPVKKIMDNNYVIKMQKPKCGESHYANLKEFVKTKPEKIEEREKPNEPLECKEKPGIFYIDKEPSKNFIAIKRNLNITNIPEEHSKDIVDGQKSVEDCNFLPSCGKSLSAHAKKADLEQNFMVSSSVNLQNSKKCEVPVEIIEKIVAVSREETKQIELLNKSGETHAEDSDSKVLQPSENGSDLCTKAPENSTHSVKNGSINVTTHLSSQSLHGSNNFISPKHFNQISCPMQNFTEVPKTQGSEITLKNENEGIAKTEEMKNGSILSVDCLLSTGNIKKDFAASDYSNGKPEEHPSHVKNYVYRDSVIKVKSSSCSEIPCENLQETVLEDIAEKAKASPEIKD